MESRYRLKYRRMRSWKCRIEADPATLALGEQEKSNADFTFLLWQYILHADNKGKRYRLAETIENE